MKKPPDNRSTSEKIAHQAWATIGVIILVVLAVPILCFGLVFFGGVLSIANEAVSNAANATPQPSNQTPR